MKRLIIIFTLLLFFSNNILCQPLQIKWQNCYGGSEHDIAYDLIEVDNGYFILGNTTSFDGNVSNNHGAEDGWLLRIDNKGDLIWEKCFGGMKGDGLLNIFNSPDGNYYLVGGAHSSDGSIGSDPYPTSLDYWIIKIDSDGNILWDKILGGNGLDQLWQADVTDNGGLITVGWTGSDDGDVTDYYGLYDIWVCKVDINGDIEWDFTLGKTLSHEFAQAVIQTSDGGYLIGGTSRPKGIGNISCVPHSWQGEAILFKLDANGQEEWQQCYGGSGDEGITELIEVDDGYLFIGFTESNDGDVSGLHGAPLDGRDDIWIVKTDFFGNIEWQHCYGGTNDEFSNKIFQTSDKGFQVFGITHSNNGDVSGNPSLTKERPSIWIFKIDSTGQFLWQQCLGGIATERVHFGVIKKSDHNFVLAGQCTYVPSGDVWCSKHGDQVNYDYWVFEVADSTVSINENTIESDIHIYPNPATSTLSIELPQNFDIKNAVIEIIDVCGGVILGIKPSSLSFNFDISKLNCGLYFVKVQNDKAVSIKRIIIQ